jgi:hypothetical protein
LIKEKYFYLKIKLINCDNNCFETIILYYNYIFFIFINIKLGIGDWGLGIGDWGLGIGPNPQSPIPNPQSPIPI